MKVIELESVDYDIRARNGLWCQTKYARHPKGCPNFPKCIETRPDFKTLPDMHWFAVIVAFDMGGHIAKMRTLYAKWTDKQCRNLLYWQQTVRAELRRGVEKLGEPGDIVLDIPEANGVNVFSTMFRAGISIDPKARTKVIKVMLVGKDRRGMVKR